MDKEVNAVTKWNGMNCEKQVECDICYIVPRTVISPEQKHDGESKHLQ